MLKTVIFLLSDLKDPRRRELGVFMRDGGKAGVGGAWESDMESRADPLPRDQTPLQGAWNCCGNNLPVD